MMDWKTLGTELAKLGLPLLGAALPVPGGAAIGTSLASMIGSGGKPEEILATLTGNTDAMLKAKQFEFTHQETMLKITVDAETAQIHDVNATLQADAKGESWLQRNHHAIESLMATGTVTAIYFVLPLLKIAVPVVPEFAWMMLGAILGVTAWQKGAAKIEQTKNS